MSTNLRLIAFQFEVFMRLGINRMPNRFNVGAALRTSKLKTTNLAICLTFLTRHYGH